MDANTLTDGTATADSQAGQQSEDNNEQTTAEQTAPAAKETPAEEAGVLSAEDLEAARQAGEQKEAPKDDEPEQDAEEIIKKLDPKSQERINKKISAAKGSAKEKEAEAAKLREENAYLKGRVEALKEIGLTQKEAEKTAQAEVAETATEIPTMPDISDYEDPKLYQQDFQAWLDQRDEVRDSKKAKQQSAEAQRQRGETEKQTAERLQQEATDKLVKRRDAVLDAVAKKHGKEAAAAISDRAAKGEFSLTKPMRDAIFDGVVSADTLKFLSDHPDISQKIANLKTPDGEPSSAAQVLEMGKLDAIITGKTPRVSGAPEPITEVRGGAPIEDDAYYSSEKISTEERIERSLARKAKARAS